MTEFLLRLGIMSLQATVIIFVVLILRLIFSKFHIAKKYTNLLWVIPYIAMILPWGVRTPFSFWQLTQEGQTKIEQAVNTMPYSTDRLVQVTIDADTLREMEENRQAPPSLENIQSQSDKKTENRKDSVIYYTTERIEGSDGFFSNLTIWDAFIYGAFSVWLVGLFGYLAYGGISSLKLKKKLICSLCLRENVYVADEIREPFVFGVFSPKIYLPCNLTKDNEYYVVEHEKTHINRKDPIKKVAAFLITGIHWFNPFAWVAFHMMTKDMEMACDEETVQRIGLEKCQDYATALLKLSTKKKSLLIPVAFGEGNVKSRIHNVLKYKKTIKVLAVLAGVVIAIVAVAFLTKPLEKTTVLSELPNYDVVRIPKADNPKAVIVTYKGEVFEFDESYYDSFRIFLEELEVYEEELNKSRAEDRPADIVIQLEGSVAYNFDENMETLWCNNGVKPSMTYELVESKSAIQFITEQISNLAIKSFEDEISNEMDDVTLLPDDITEFPGNIADISNYCGENGPFLDFANDKYVIFHTVDKFYVYDIELGEICMRIGFTDIFKVEVDANNLKACVHDVVGDMITIYECDLLDLSCLLYGPTEVDAFDDFLVTSDCVVHDPTVFRTKECVQISDGSYLYLESGSGLLEDLSLVNEDKKGNRTLYEIFDSQTDENDQEKTMQFFTGAYYMEPVDFTHDGKKEYLVIDIKDIQSDRQAQTYLKVTDEGGKVLWQNELGLPRAGWNSYYLVWTKEGACLLQYLPVVAQERGSYQYRLFYLDEDGSEVEMATDTLEFLTEPLNVDTEVDMAIPKEAMIEFAEDVNGYLENARLLISTVDGILLYQTPSKSYGYKEKYKKPLEMSGIQVSESVDLNITKLQNYYENVKKDILKKDGVILMEE